MSANFLGIEIGGTKLQFVVGSADGSIRERRKFHVDAARGADDIREQMAAALEELSPVTNISAIGVGFGGPVDFRTGRVCRSHQVEGWSEFDLGGWIASRSGLQVVIENDANAAALGEAVCGAGRGANPVFYVTLGSGVGGGLVVDGRIYHGAKPGEAEIGHVRLDRRGVIVEDCCSGWAVDRKVREWTRREPAGALAGLAAGSTGGEARFLAPAMAQGDAAARRILQETADDLGFALSHVTQLMHPEVIVIGGGLSLLGEPLRAAVEQSLRAWVMEVFRPGPRVALAGLGEDAVPVGALLLAATCLRAP